MLILFGELRFRGEFFEDPTSTIRRNLFKLKYKVLFFVRYGLLEIESVFRIIRGACRGRRDQKISDEAGNLLFLLRDYAVVPGARDKGSLSFFRLHGALVQFNYSKRVGSES